MPENEENRPEPKTFSQEQVNTLLAAERRTAAEKFTDYDTLKSKAEQFDAAEQASQTELQRVTAESETLKTQLAAYQLKEQVTGWAADIVKDSAIPASVLRGSTKEELEAHFTELQALTPKPKRTPVPAGDPVEHGGGSRAAAAIRQMRGQE